MSLHQTLVSKVSKKAATGFARTILFATLLGAALTSQAQASVLVTLWQGTNPGGAIGDAMEQALPSNPLASGTPLATFTYNGDLSWLAVDPSNFLDTFVGFSGGTVSGCAGTACSSTTALAHLLLSSPGFSLTSLFEIVFTTSGPETGSIIHDDGISIWNATDTTMFLDSSFPTAAIPSLYSLPGAGTYHLWYVEANGAPSVLDVNPDQIVPEPAALLLIATALLGLLGLGWSRRRFSRLT